MATNNLQPGIEEQFRVFAERVRQNDKLIATGRLRRLVGMTLEAEGCRVPVGSRCLVVSEQCRVEAEVVGFDGDRTYLVPLDDFRGITPGARVIPQATGYEVGVGPRLLGRVIDGVGRPLDGRGAIEYERRIPLHERPPNPLHRRPVDRPLDVGVRSINALLTVGQGQRVGLFAGSGFGKSVLLGMMTRFTEADIIVVGLIGERGREVKEFIDRSLGPEAMRRAVVVVSPADTSPVHRIHAAWLATAIARDFRNQGKRVLLLMDSLTRFAQAQREIALAIGEPPATKGYTPSVFAKLSELVERSGNGPGQGTLTAFYTVLVEGNDPSDPVADSARSLLDGHITLSRQLAEAGIYPAIDIDASISRVMNDIVPAEHQQLAMQFAHIHSTYQQNRDLIAVGAYEHGTDPVIDQAIGHHPGMLAFLRQDLNQPSGSIKASRSWHPCCNDLWYVESRLPVG